MKIAAALCSAPVVAVADLPAWDGAWTTAGDSCEEMEPSVYDGAAYYHLKTDCEVTRAERLDLPGGWRMSTMCREETREFTQEYVLLMTVHDRMFIWYGEEDAQLLELERCD